MSFETDMDPENAMTPHRGTSLATPCQSKVPHHPGYKPSFSTVTKT
jgi:hypothetical protein